MTLPRSWQVEGKTLRGRVLEQKDRVARNENEKPMGRKAYDELQKLYRKFDDE